MQRIRRFRGVWIVYFICSAWIWLQAPYDIPILWLTVLGLWKWPLVFLGPLAKIPFETILIAPKVWKFVTTRPFIASDFQYYLLMGCVFIAVCLQILGQSVMRKRVEATRNVE